MLELIKSWLKA